MSIRVKTLTSGIPVPIDVVNPVGFVIVLGDDDGADDLSGNDSAGVRGAGPAPQGFHLVQAGVSAEHL